MKEGIFNQPLRPKSNSKKIKSPYEFDPAHTNTRAGPKVAAGDYYGTGFKAKVGKIKDWSAPGANPVPNYKIKKPPKSLA